MNRAPDPLAVHYLSGAAMRSRGVAAAALTATLDVPPAPARAAADWEREIATRLCLEPGDVEQMPLARTRARWPGFGRCLDAMRGWTGALGLAAALDEADMALMACRGARFHHDAGQYGDAVFCNLFLSEDKGLDVVFPGSGQRIALARGTAMIFDTAQPHAVVPRGRDRFRESDFAGGADLSQLFLTWELPVEAPGVAQALGIVFDVDAPQDEEQVRRGGARVEVDPASGRWRAPA